jgi:hypothetical protein
MSKKDCLLQAELAVTAELAYALITMTEDPDEVLELATIGWRKLVAADRHEAALDVVVPVTHRLSNTGRNPQSHAFVNAFIEAVGATTIAGWPPREQARLLVEVANCRRCGADPHGARAEYEKVHQLLGEDMRDPMVRLNMRNLAIVMRECGEGQRSMHILEQLLPFAKRSERVALESSLLVAYFDWGHHEKGLELGRKIAARVDRIEWRKLDYRAVGHSVSSVLLIHGSVAESGLAWPILEEIYRGAQLDGDVINRGLAAYRLYDSPLRERFPQGQFEQDLDAMLDVVAAPSAAKSPTTPHVVEMLMAHPERFPMGARHMRAILRNFVEQWADSASLTVGSAWQYLQRLGHEEQDGDAVSEAVFASLDSVVRFAVTIDPDGDPYHVLQKVRTIPQMAATLALQSYSNMPPQFAMAASDIGASLVLSSRICAKAGIPIKEFDDIVQLMADWNIRDLLPVGTAMIQVLTGDSVTFLITSRTEQGTLAHSLRPCQVSRERWQELAADMQYCLNLARPTDKRDPLARVSNWSAFLGFLEPMLASLNAESVLWIAGGLSTTPVALAAPSGLRMSFCPSLLTALALARIARQRGVGPGWRPQRAFDAAVWRQAEASPNVEAIRGASAAWRQSCEAAGVAYTGKSGAQADAAAILQGWSDCDIARVACHGRASANNYSSAFLVASENNLPPSAILPRHGKGLTPYLLEWDQVSKLDSTPTVVVSAGCDTGQTVHSRADERLGLERAFLLAGTLHYAAPQWPVPMLQVQDMSARLFQRWLGNPGATICGTLAELTAEQEATGVPRWIARSLTSFGLTSL